MSSSTSSTSRALRVRRAVNYRESPPPPKRRRAGRVPWDAPCNLVDAITDADVIDGEAKLCVRFKDGFVCWQALDTIKDAQAEMFQGWIKSIAGAERMIIDSTAQVDRLKREVRDKNRVAECAVMASERAVFNAERAVNANRNQQKIIGRLQSDLVKTRRALKKREISYLNSLANEEKLCRLLEKEKAKNARLYGFARRSSGPLPPRPSSPSITEHMPPRPVLRRQNAVVFPRLRATPQSPPPPPLPLVGIPADLPPLLSPEASQEIARAQEREREVILVEDSQGSESEEF